MRLRKDSAAQIQDGQHGGNLRHAGGFLFQLLSLVMGD
jgi:hypothetical protein